jgi:hypothetical protein
LRIGNWVNNGITKKAQKVMNYEDPVEYGYELDDIKNNPNIVKPIPLTEEWLIKFGFDEIDRYVQ